MSRVKNAALLMQKLFTMMDTPTVFHATSIHPESVTLDYYDQRCENEYHCEDTLYAFGSEAYQPTLVNDTRSILMEMN